MSTEKIKAAYERMVVARAGADEYAAAPPVDLRVLRTLMHELFAATDEYIAALTEFTDLHPRTDKQQLPKSPTDN